MTPFASRDSIRWWRTGCIAAAMLLVTSSVAAQDARTLDAFDDARAWTAVPADGVSLTLASDSGVVGRAMRMDVDYHGGGGYAVARRALPIELPENYAITFWLRSDLPPNTLEFKLIDASGENVWWATRRDMTFSRTWSKVTIRRRHITFAWGPQGGGELRRAASLEIAITAGSGGKGSVWIDELAIKPLAPRVVGEIAPVGPWRSTADGVQTFDVDFGASREYGGVAIDWDARDRAVDYDLQASDDGTTWTTLRSVRGAAAGRRFHLLGEGESRWLRVRALRSARGAGYALDRLRMLPLADGASRTAFLERVASEAPAGRWPRAFARQQSYWTIVGPSGGRRTALLGEDGNVEARPAGPSLEPFLRVDGRLLTWRDGRTSHSLDGGSRPIPSMRRVADDVALDVTALSAGSPERPTLWVRYRVVNRAARARTIDLAVALRPVQVNPPWQFLSIAGGASDVHDVAWTGQRLVVNAVDTIVPMTAPTTVGALPFDGGSVVDSLAVGARPSSARVVDSTGMASAAMTWSLAIAAGDSADVVVAWPTPGGDGARGTWRAALAATRARWDSAARVGLRFPSAAGGVDRAVATAIDHILVNRDGPAIRPGTRSYARSWIRDGALTSTALLRMGHADAVRDFVRWFVPFQYANGKVPCCVDRRGADPVPENDSNGELIYLVAEYWRHTGDTAMVRETWPNVVRAVAYMDSLRRSRTTPIYATPDSQHLYGLLPPSISHEGYSDKAAYSYWDDFFALRGFADAAALARVVEPARAGELAAIRDAFKRDLARSIDRARMRHGITFIPGAADRGDFDATSTTIALAPGNDLAWLPRDAVRATFDRYWSEFVARRDGAKAWDAYTPYEWRVVGSYVRLGEPARAWALIDWFMRDRRPTAWNQWGEVVWREVRAPKFVGDMPHGWVASDFIRSALDLVAYEREADSTLVVGAGIPLRLARADGGVALRGLSTWWGSLDATVRAPTADRVTITLGGTARPPGGLRIHAPFDARRPTSATVDGRRATLAADGSVAASHLPATIQFRY